MGGLVEYAGDLDQGFRGHATGPEAVAAGPIALYQGNLLACP